MRSVPEVPVNQLPETASGQGTFFLLAGPARSCVEILGAQDEGEGKCVELPSSFSSRLGAAFFQPGSIIKTMRTCPDEYRRDRNGEKGISLIARYKESTGKF
jgi:hypothetical protein